MVKRRTRKGRMFLFLCGMVCTAIACSDNPYRITEEVPQTPRFETISNTLVLDETSIGARKELRQKSFSNIDAALYRYQLVREAESVFITPYIEAFESVTRFGKLTQTDVMRWKRSIIIKEEHVHAEVTVSEQEGGYFWKMDVEGPEGTYEVFTLFTDTDGNIVSGKIHCYRNEQRTAQIVHTGDHTYRLELGQQHQSQYIRLDLQTSKREVSVRYDSRFESFELSIQKPEESGRVQFGNALLCWGQDFGNALCTS
ncbi:MAG: hypothetical protein AAFW89_08295 [Bacteroidota bacterium]